MRLPTYKELAREDEQLEVLEYPLDRPLFVVGPPGSGKTVLAIQRAQMVADAEPSVVVVTYNRMLRRLFELLNDSGADAQTMHSFLWQDYRERMNENPPRYPYDQYAYQWPSILQRLRQEDILPNRSHLIVDEGQDLPEGFFRYVSRHVSRTVTVFADEDQALGDRRTTLEQIRNATGLDDPIILGGNHRNTPEVARLAEHFHSGRLPAAAVRRVSSGAMPRLIRSPNLHSTTDLISNWCNTRGGSVGVIVYGNDAGNDVRNRLADRLPGKRVDMYRNQCRNEDSIDVLRPGVTVLNKESVKGQEFDAVFILELERFIPCANDAERRVMYMMCARARDNLLLVYGPGNLSPEAHGDLPGPDVLERS